MSKIRKIINEDGSVLTGLIENQKISFNYKDYKLLNFFDKEVKGLKKRLKFHHFNYYALLSKKYVLAFAVVDLAYVKSMFIYLYDYKGRFLLKKDIKILPLSKKLEFPPSPDKYKIKYKSKKDKLSVKKDFHDNTMSIKIEMKDLKLKLKAKYGSNNNPLKVVIPAGHNGWTFTEKCSNINSFEELSVKFKDEELDFKDSSLIYDWSGGYLKRETNWIWASFSGLNEEAKLIGANFAAMVNETYDTENMYWINDKSFKQNAIKFNYDKSDVYSTWHIENYNLDNSKSKKVKIKFTPMDEINDNSNAFLVKNSFKQFMGKFSGYFIDENNKKVEFKDISGVTEIHKALW